MSLSDLYAHPFSSASAQNRIITSGAIFGDSSHSYSVALQLNGNPNLNGGQGFAGGFTIVVLNSSSDSSKTVTYNNDGVGGLNLPVTLRIPVVTPNATGERVVIVFDYVSENAYEFYHFSWNSGSPTAGKVHIFNPAGLGHPTSGNTTRVGASASGVSVLLGLNRGTELTSGAINHIMHVTLQNQGTDQQLSMSTVWPAYYIDGYCGGSNCVGAIPYGQLFAIPPSVDKFSIGLNELGERLFDQLANYGLRPIDGAGNNAHARGDQTVTSGQRTEFSAQMGLLWPYLRPVLNDAEGAAAGIAAGISTAVATGNDAGTYLANAAGTSTATAVASGLLASAAGTSTAVGVAAGIHIAIASATGTSAAIATDLEIPIEASDTEAMSLLSIINEVQDRTDLPRAGAVIGSTDQNTIQLLALANEHGRSLVRDNVWRRLISQETFVTSASETQTNFFPANFYKLIDNSMWNRSRLVPMIGPLTSQEWQTIKVTTISSLYPVWRHSSNIRDIQIMPTPDAGEIIGYDCMNKAWVTLATGGSGTRFINDSDTVVYDEELMILGIKWRWLKHKQLDWEPAKMEYDIVLRQLIASDSARRTISMAKSAEFDVEPPEPIIPDRIMI